MGRFLSLIIWQVAELGNSRTRHYKCVEFVGSLLCSERFFSGCSGFQLSLEKTNSSKFQFNHGMPGHS